jgi:hypothetical protein
MIVLRNGFRGASLGMTDLEGAFPKQRSAKPQNVGKFTFSGSQRRNGPRSGKKAHRPKPVRDV